MNKVIILFVFIILLIGLTNAREYNVKQDGTGDFTTAQACANVAVTGDTCLIYPGRYDERVTVKSSGTDANFINFKGAGGSILKGISITGKSHIRIEGIEFTNQNFTAERYATASIFMDSVNNITIINNVIHNTSSTCIRARAQSPSLPSNSVKVMSNRISYCGGLNNVTAGIGVDIYGSNNFVEGNDISHIGNDFVRMTGGDYNVVRNNKFRDNSNSDWNNGLGISSEHIDGMQNYCPTGGLAFNHLLVENNVLSDSPDKETHFVIFQDMGRCGSSNAIVRYNNVYRLGSHFMINDDSVKDIILYHNTITDSGIAGNPKDWAILGYFGNSGGGKVLNNLFYNVVRNGGSIYNYDDSSMAGFYADYNLGYNSECDATCTWTNPSRGILNEQHEILNKNPSIKDKLTGELESNSIAINSGGQLTYVRSDDPGNGQEIILENVKFFQDGWAGVEPDWIAVGSADNIAQIRSIDYGNNKLTLSNTISRKSGDPVYLYKDSSGRRVLYGNSPDIGAYEYIGDINKNIIYAKEDLNLDGKIDILDVIIIVNNLNSIDTKYDINSDGKVNVIDMIYVIKRFS